MPDLARHFQGLGSKPALVIVDVIRGFTNPACALGSEAEAVVAANRKLLKAFRIEGLPVYFTTVVYRDSNEARVFRGRLPALNELQPGSPWVEVDPRLERRDSEALVEKRWASAFFGTDLDAQLRSRGVDSLVITGLTTSGCVRATVVDGLQYDYRVVVPREAVGDRNPDAHEANLFDMHAKYADVMSIEEVLTSIPSTNTEMAN